MSAARSKEELEKLKLSEMALKAKIREVRAKLDYKSIISLSDILIKKQTKILSIISTSRKDLVDSHEERCIASLMQHGDEKKEGVKLKMLADAKKDFEYVVDNMSAEDSHFEKTNQCIDRMIAVLNILKETHPPHEQSTIKQLERISAIIQVLLDYLKERISDQNKVLAYKLWFETTLSSDKPKEAKEMFNQLLTIYDKDSGTKEFFNTVIDASTQLINTLKQQKKIDIEAIEALYHICIKILMVTNKKTEDIAKTFQNLINTVYQYRPEDAPGVYNRLINEKIHDVIDQEEKKENTNTLFYVFKKIKPQNKAAIAQLCEVMKKQSADKKIDSSIKAITTLPILSIESKKNIPRLASDSSKLELLSVEELNNEITNAFKTFNYQKAIEYEEKLILKQKEMKVAYYKNLFTARMMLYAENEIDGSILKQAFTDFESAVDLDNSSPDRFEKTNVLIHELWILLSDHINYVRQLNDEETRLKELNRVRIVMNLLLGYLKERISDANLILLHHSIYETTLFMEKGKEAKGMLNTLFTLLNKKSESTTYLNNVIFSTTQLIAHLMTQADKDLETIKQLYIICVKARIRKKENNESIAKTFQNLFDLVKHNNSKEMPTVYNSVIQEIIHDVNQKENIETLIKVFQKINPRQDIVIDQLCERLKQASELKGESKDNNSEENNILNTVEQNAKCIKEAMDNGEYQVAIKHSEQNIRLLKENKEILEEENRKTKLYNLHLDLAAAYLFHDPNAFVQKITDLLKETQKLSEQDMMLDEFADRLMRLADNETKKLNSIEKYNAITPALEKIFTNLDAKPEHSAEMYGYLLNIYIKADQEKKAGAILSKVLKCSESKEDKKSTLEILLSRVPAADLDSSSHDDIFKFGPMILRLVSAKDYPKNILKDRYLLLAVRQFLEKGNKNNIIQLLKKVFEWSAPEEEKALYKKIIELSINPERIDSKTAEGMISIFKEINPINPYMATLKETINKKFRTLENKEKPIDPIPSLPTQKGKIPSGKKGSKNLNNKQNEKKIVLQVAPPIKPAPVIINAADREKAEKDAKLCNEIRNQSNDIKKDIDNKIREFKKTFSSIYKVNKDTLAAEAKTKPRNTAKKIISTLKEMEKIEADYLQLLKKISQAIEKSNDLSKALPSKTGESENQDEIKQNIIYLENQRTQIEKNLNRVLEDKQSLNKIMQGLKDRTLKPYQAILDDATSCHNTIVTKKDDFKKNIEIKTSNLSDLTIEQLRKIAADLDTEQSKIIRSSKDYSKSIKDRLESCSTPTSQDLANVLEMSFDSIRKEIKNKTDAIDKLTNEIEMLSSESLNKVSNAIETLVEKQAAVEREIEKRNSEEKKLAEEANNKKRQVMILLQKFDETASQLQFQSTLLSRELIEIEHRIRSLSQSQEPNKIILEIEMRMNLIAKAIAEHESCFNNFESEFKLSSDIDSHRKNRIIKCDDHLKSIKKQNETNQNNLNMLKHHYAIRDQKAQDDLRICHEYCDKAINEANECLALYVAALAKIKTACESEYKNIGSKKLAEEKLFKEDQDLSDASKKLKKAKELLKSATTCYDTSIMPSEAISLAHFNEIAQKLKDTRQSVSDAGNTFDQYCSKLNSIKKSFSTLLTDLKKAPALDDLQLLQAKLDEHKIIFKGGFSIVCGGLHYNSFEAAKRVGLNDIDGSIFMENPDALVNRLEKEGFKRSFTGYVPNTSKISFITITKEVEGVKIDLTIADPTTYPGNQLVSPLLSGKVRILDEKELKKDPARFDIVEEINKNYIIAIDNSAPYFDHFKLATQGSFEGYERYTPVKGINYNRGHVNYLNLLRKAHEKFKAISSSSKTLVDSGKKYLSYKNALAELENQFVDLFISGERHPDYEIDKVLKEVNPFNEYDLADMSDKNDLKQNIIKIKCEDKGLSYRVFGVDNKVKSGLIPWDKLPPDFPRENTKILAYKSNLLPYILIVTSAVGHTSIYNDNILYLALYLRARIRYANQLHGKIFNTDHISSIVQTALFNLASSGEIIDSTTLKKFADACFFQAYQVYQPQWVELPQRGHPPKSSPLRDNSFLGLKQLQDAKPGPSNKFSRGLRT